MGFAPTPESSVVALGRGGVTLFFLLSGYLIFKSVEAEPGPVFALRRFFKVMPSYWLNILVILALDLALTTFPHMGWASYAADAAVLTDILGTAPVSGVFWTLFVEIKFYFFILLQYALLGRRFSLVVVVGLLVIEGAVWLWRGHGSTTLAYFPVFYIGIELALAESAQWSRVHILRVVGLTAVLAASLVLFLDRLKWASAGYLIASVCLFMAFTGWRARNRPLIFLGVTSYSTYLYHSLVMTWVFETFPSMRSTPLGFFVLVGTMALAVAVGAVMYRLVEVPMVRLGRRLESSRLIPYIGRHDRTSR